MKFLLLPTTLAFGASALVSGALLVWGMIGKGGGAKAVSPAQLTHLVNNSNAIVIDVRDAAEFASGTVTGARHIPLAELDKRAEELARFKNRPAVLICASGARAARGLSALATAGFAEVYNLSGGIAAWRDAGLPLVKPAAGGPKKEK